MTTIHSTGNRSTATLQAKEALKASLMAEIEPINTEIADLGKLIDVLKAKKRDAENELKNLDRKPSQGGRVWSAEAKQKLSIALKASAARKKAALAAVVAPTTAPVVDNKMKAANDDSATPAPAKKAAKK